MEAVLEAAAVGLPDNEVFGELIVLDRTGDSRLQWSKNNRAQVAAAKIRFDELRAAGYVAHEVNADGSMGGVLAEFDAGVQRIIMHKQLIGG